MGIFDRPDRSARSRAKTEFEAGEISYGSFHGLSKEKTGIPIIHKQANHRAIASHRPLVTWHSST